MEIATLFVQFLCVIVGAVLLWNIIKLIRMFIPERKPVDRRTNAQYYAAQKKKEIAPVEERPLEFTGIRAIRF